MSGQGSPGVCDLCGQKVAPGEGFVSIGPGEMAVPPFPSSQNWVAPGTDIHGGTPFVVEHARCFAEAKGQRALDDLQKAAPKDE